MLLWFTDSLKSRIAHELGLRRKWWSTMPISICLSLGTRFIMLIWWWRRSYFCRETYRLIKLRKHFQLSTKGCWHPVGYALQLNLARQMSNEFGSFMPTLWRLKWHQSWLLSGARLSIIGRKQLIRYMGYSTMISRPSLTKIVSLVLGWLQRYVRTEMFHGPPQRPKFMLIPMKTMAWMSIVCNRISPSGNISNNPTFRTQIVTWIYEQCPCYERH